MQSNIPLYLKIHTYHICNVCILRRLKNPYYERTLAEIVYIYLSNENKILKNFVLYMSLPWDQWFFPACNFEIDQHELYLLWVCFLSCRHALGS